MVLYLDRMCQRGLHAVIWPRCRTLQYSRTFISFSVSLWNGLANPVFRWCETGGLQEQGQCFSIGLSCSIPTIILYSLSLSLFSVYRLVLWGFGLRTDRVYIISPSLALPTFFNNNNKKKSDVNYQLFAVIY